MSWYNQDNQASQESGSRRGNLASRNASSFDIISFNPNSQGNSKDQERFDKLQKQAAYRDQLNSMVTSKNDQKRSQRVPTEEYNPTGYREQDYQRERRVEQRYPDQDDRRLDEEANAQDKKKRMLQEMNEANRRAAESKANDKKRQKAQELATDYQRNQDSLSQFEREGFRQKETKRLMNEETTRVLEQQKRDFNSRKQDQDQYDSVDNLHYHQNDRQASYPLAPSYTKINQAQPQSLDHLSHKMDKISVNCPFARDDNENYQGQQQSQHGKKRFDEQQSRSNIDTGSQYQNNKGRAQYSSYNIINHQG